MLKSLSDITDAELQEIQNMAAVFFTPGQIAQVMELDAKVFEEECNTAGNKFYDAFAGARLKSEYELRWSIVKLAKSGSSPAQTMALEMVKNSQLKMMQ